MLAMIPEKDELFAADGVVAPAEELASLTLDERGMIRDCDSGGEKLFGYRRSEMVWRHVSMLLPQLADIPVVANGEVNGDLRYFCRIGGHFQAHRRDGERFASDIFINDLRNPGSRNFSLIVRRAA